jgi:predicted nuclease of predicted toxin-antitoxin system
MMIWIDAQISPAVAAWIESSFPVGAKAVRDLGMRDAMDDEIFAAAKRENAVVMTKDRDFVALLDRLGPPPQVIWLRCGNTSNARLREILSRTLSEALRLLAAGESLVEITAV